MSKKDKIGDLSDPYRVKEGKRLKLEKYNPDDTGDYSGDDRKIRAEEQTKVLLERLFKLQERLYAGQQNSLLIVLQAMDAGGKDGTIKNVFRGLNPQGVRVTSFKVPSSEEAGHDFLWRVHKEAPARGMMAVFNRSHYEDVLVTRVHGLVKDKEAKRRFDHIRNFERLLLERGTLVVKFFLHISKEEQAQRLQARIDDPERRWKFSPSDLEERKLWDSYQSAFEDALSETSSVDAPWYVIPANHKWYRNLVIVDALVKALVDLGPQLPPEPAGVDFSSLRVV